MDRWTELSLVWSEKKLRINFFIIKLQESGSAGKLHEGVYTMLGGPNFETVAELKMLKICGVDAVGN